MMSLPIVILIGAVLGALDGAGIFFAIAIGALCGLAFALVIYLGKGGPKSGDAPYVVPSGIITGALIGLFILIWAIRPT